MGSTRHVDDISALDNLYMLEADDQEDHAPKGFNYHEAAREAGSSIRMLGGVMLFGWGVMVAIFCWLLWRALHG